MYRVKIVIYYIFHCIKLGVKPWKYFQINEKYFNENKGIFSKYEIEEKIPDKWKLPSISITFPFNNTKIKQLEDNLGYPLFLKPEWGQNSHGIKVIHSREELKMNIKDISRYSIDYVAQKAAKYKKEFEILFIKNPNSKIKIISAVESKNDLGCVQCINGIHGETTYHDILSDLSNDQINKIIDYISEINHFNLGRIGIKSNSINDLIEGRFEIFEINIFIPFALHLLDKNIPKKSKNIFINNFALSLAKLTKNINSSGKEKSIFFRLIRKHYFIKIQHNNIYMKLKKIIYSWIENTFMDGCSDYNSIDVRRSCRSKKQARNMFEKNNIPHAKGLVFFNPYSAYKFVKQHGFPIVLKPNVGGYSRGSFFPIENFKDFWKAMFFVKLWWPTSVVEQYLLGKNYRVVVTKGSVDIAMQRYPGFVIGDGNKSISTLIDEENKIRKSMNLLPIIHEIEKSSKIKKHIKKQGYTLDSILEKDKNLELYHRVSLAPGGVLETVEVDTITEKNKELFIKILDMFEANIFGIDVIMEKGIDIDFDKQKCIFLEVNSRAYLEMHRKPRYGNPVDLGPLHEKLSKIEIIGKGTY